MSGGLVASADAQATRAGVAALADGGNAADAALATSAAMAVVAPHLCGMGGDVFALVARDGRVEALDAAGRAPSGADAAAMRAEGLREMPMRGDLRAVTVPGAVAGWVELHRRHCTMPLARLLAPAIELAERGFAASPLLVGALGAVPAAHTAGFADIAAQARAAGARSTRPPVGAARRASAAGARAGGDAGARGAREAHYLGAFGRGLRAMAPQLYAESDLAAARADWVAPLSLDAWDVRLWSMPAPSQGYLWLAAAAGAAALGDELPDDPDDPRWAHALVELSTAVGHDRPEALWDGADLAGRLGGLVDRCRTVASGGLVDPARASARPMRGADGDTTYLCAMDDSGMGVSLINSNASGLGSLLVEPSTGINLHNRGLGFSLAAGHPAEYRPGAAPPHTLCPGLVTSADDAQECRAVLGTMGGDAQPQIVLQLLARLFGRGAGPLDAARVAAAVDAGRWALRGPSTGFDTWTSGRAPTVQVEGDAPARWADGLAALGHEVERRGARDSGFGHAHVVARGADGALVGAADPRCVVGACAPGAGA
ncbi:MAG: gamma-glutamyltransferase [Acidimicrobiia bacterium]